MVERGRITDGEASSRGARLILVFGVVALLAAIAVIFFLTRPEEGSTTASARVLEPKVEKQAPTAAGFSGVASGDVLTEGTQVRTDEGGMAELAFDDGSVARLGANTIFTIDKLDAKVGSRQIEGNLEVGETWHKVSKLSGSENRYEVDTAVAVAAVRGTSFAVVCLKVRVCDFTVIDGEIRIELPDGTVDILGVNETVHIEDNVVGPIRTLTTEDLANDPWIVTNVTLDANQTPAPTSSTSSSTTTTTRPTSTTAATGASGGESASGGTPTTRTSGGGSTPTTVRRTTTTSRPFGTTTTSAPGSTTTVSFYPEGTTSTVPDPGATTTTTAPDGSTTSTTSTSTSTSTSTAPTTVPPTTETTPSTVPPTTETTPSTTPTTLSGSAISGTVTDEASGNPVSGICVLAGGFMTESGADGTYSLPVDPDTYRVSFSDCRLTPSYAPEFHSGRLDFIDADPIKVFPGQSVSGIDASLRPGGSIAGRVVAAENTNIPLSGVCVTASSDDYDIGGSDTTDAAGDYTISGLPAGTYKVVFTDCAAGDRLGEAYNDRVDPVDADAVVVSAGATTSGIDADLSIGGAISGTVTTAEGNAPLQGICVRAQGGNAPLVEDTTGPDGSYSIRGLTTAHYQVLFIDCRLSANRAPEYFGTDTDNPSESAPVTVVAPNPTNGIDAAMASGGFITGQVEREEDGTPLPGACVSVTRDRSLDAVSTVSAGPDGSYAFGPLPASTYLVQAFGCGSASGRPARWFGGTTKAEASRIVLVNGQNASGSDIALPPPGGGGGTGSITGVVTAEESGAPLQGFCVRATNLSTFAVTSASTDASGNYAVTNLGPGNYQVRFEQCTGQVDRVSEYWNNQPSAATADPVAVANGATTSGINAALTRTGGISGRVIDEVTGQPIQHICVETTGPTFRSARTDATGTYTINAIKPGVHQVHFFDCDDEPRYVEEHFDDQANPGSATPVTITAGQTTSGIDAALATGGSISGRITTDEAPGAPLGRICVVADGPTIQSALTHTDGTYKVGALAPGSYTVSFSDCSFEGFRISEFYDDQPDVSSATPVAVTPQQHVAGIDATLAKGGSIRGRITAAEDGLPLAEACVWVESGPTITTAQASLDGNYVLGGLEPGSYEIKFRVCTSERAEEDWAPELHNNRRPGVGTADPITVALGAATTVDAQLAKGGTITGTVTGPGGAPVTRACVKAWTPGRTYEEALVQTGVDGRYWIPGLPVGDHILEVSPCGGDDLASEWYDNQPSEATATLIPLTSGSVFVADVQLAPNP